MILNDVEFSDSKHANRLHGVSITLVQIEALKKWRVFEVVTGYTPTAVELSELTSSPPSTIRRWMNGWEESGVIDRGKGLRNQFITEKGHRLIAELTSLQSLWETYIEKREALIRDYPKITASG